MRVRLNEADHTYTDDRGQMYKSVSGIIGQFKHPFDPHEVQANGKTLLQNYVAKNGYTEQYWLSKWDNKRDYACEKGHAFHALKEMIVNSQATYKTSEGNFLPVRNIELMWQILGDGMFGKLLPGVYTEMCMWNFKSKAAGTGDLTTIFPNLEFDIDDYKTNGVFKTESYRNRSMKWPCTHLPDCHYGHYSVQLNLYAWFLVQFGLKCRNLRLWHYDIPDSEVAAIVKHGILPDIEPTLHEVAYDPEMADAIMKLRINTLTK